MGNYIAINRYELIQPFGPNAKTNKIILSTKSNSQGIHQVHANFSARRNERELIQILEDNITKVRNIRLLLGENDFSGFLDFLRNEQNRGIFFAFDPSNSSSFVTGTDTETNIEGGPFTVTNLDVFALKTMSSGINKNLFSRAVNIALGR